MRILLATALILGSGCSVLEEKTVELSERGGEKLGALLSEKLTAEQQSLVAGVVEKVASKVEESHPFGGPNSPLWATALLAFLYQLRKKLALAAGKTGEV